MVARGVSQSCFFAVSESPSHIDMKSLTAVSAGGDMGMEIDIEKVGLVQYLVSKGNAAPPI